MLYFGDFTIVLNLHKKQRSMETCVLESPSFYPAEHRLAVSAEHLPAPIVVWMDLGPVMRVGESVNE